MSLVRPFPARIVGQEWAQQVVCPMHDALSPADRSELLRTNPLSYLHVTQSVLDLPSATVDEIGAANAAGLERLLAAGTYSPLSQPAMYVYRLHLGSEEHTGIVAELDAAAFTDGRILGHEAVQPARVEALVHHFGAVPTRSELVTVMHRSDEVVNRVMAVTTEDEPVLTVTDLTGVEQVVWRVADADAALIAERLAPARHYIADGHHRVAATVARWRDHGSPRGGGVLSVLYPDDQMHLLAFHRRVAGPVDADRFLDEASAAVDVEVADGPTPARGRFGMRLGGRWYVLRPTDAGRPPGVAGLDVSILDDRVLRPFLGVASGDDRVHYVSELANLDEAVAETDADGGALFLLTGPRLDEVVVVAERGEVMPQKSTYIEPKPRAGVFLRPRQGPVDPRDLPQPTA
jgi:uncharacterized protein (DUF1015 family)